MPARIIQLSKNAQYNAPLIGSTLRFLTVTARNAAEKTALLCGEGG
jgi:hypothetical protein